MSTGGHLLKPSLSRSKKWRKLESNIDRFTYCMLVAAVDSWGMMPADAQSLKYKLGPYDENAPDEFFRAVIRLAKAGLLALWEDQDDPWLYVVAHDIQQKNGIRHRKGEPDVARPAWVEKGGCRIKTDPDQINNGPPPDQEQESNKLKTDQQQTRSETDQDQIDPRLRSAMKGIELKGIEVEVKDLKLKTKETNTRTIETSLPQQSAQRLSNIVPDVLEGMGRQRVSPLKPPGQFSEPEKNSKPSKSDDVDFNSSKKTKRKNPINQAAESFQKLWMLNTAPRLSGDHLKRARIAYKQFGEESFLAAVRGHHKLASRDGSLIGKSFRHVFPGETIDGKYQQDSLDLDRFQEFVEKGLPKKPPDSRPKTELQVAIERRDKLEAEESVQWVKDQGLNKLSGPEMVREAMKRGRANR
jgi:hypothetical protein